MKQSRVTIPTDHPTLVVQVTDDGSRTLIDRFTGVAFHSASGAASETRHVYLRNSGVLEKLGRHSPVRVLEIGLGTSLGMLLTLDSAITHQSPIEYTAVERDWLPNDLLRQLELETLLGDSSLADRYFDWRDTLKNSDGRPLLAGRYLWQVSDLHQIQVCLMDARRFLANDIASDSDRYDAIYFDPFDPEVDVELWQTETLTMLRDRLADQGRLVTYCVSRRVRDAMVEAGFIVSKTKGPIGGKREVMIATPMPRGSFGF